MELIGELYAHRLILTWKRDKRDGWELTSGAWSPFYFMFRHVPFFPNLFRYSVDSLTSLVEDVKKHSPVDVLVGVASTGIPLAAGVSLQTGVPLAYTRKVAGVRTLQDLLSNSAAWGQHTLVEGQFESGMHYLLVDDVVTGGASKELAKQQVEVEADRRDIRLKFVGTVVVVDRGFPGHDCSRFNILAAHRLYDEMDQILQFGGTQQEVDVMRRYLERPDMFQDVDTRAELLR